MVILLPKNWQCSIVKDIGRKEAIIAAAACVNIANPGVVFFYVFVFNRRMFWVQENLPSATVKFK